jgi:hypothetical protein
MSITIAATATGSLTPPTAVDENVVNGDFLIVRNRVPGLVTGDGLDEDTSWTFYFDDDPNLSMLSRSQPLTSARLTLTLTPQDDPGITTDGVWIESLELIGGKTPNAPEIQDLPIGVTSTITIELLNRLPSYTSTAILGILFSGIGGQISMRYNDDAIISSATLELTQES